MQAWYPKIIEANNTENSNVKEKSGKVNLLSAYDVISSHVIAVMQWPVGLNTSCFSSGLAQNS